MKYAWIENDKIRDVAHSNPAEIYHPDVAAFYTTQVPDDAVNGDGWVNGALVKPEPPAPAAPEPVKWTTDDIRKGLTLAERVKWDNDKSDEIKTAKVELTGSNFKAKVQEVLDMLVASGDVSQASATAILAKTNGDTIPVSVT
jgi:hypothetical protein